MIKFFRILSMLFISSFFCVSIYASPTTYDLKQDKKIQKNTDRIITERDKRKEADQKLNDKIKTERQDRKDADKLQDKLLQAHSNKIDEIDNRVNKLERTQYVIEPEVRILDTKRLEVKPFFRYNITREKIDTVGVRFTMKIGKSYEEKKITELERRLQELEGKRLRICEEEK